MRTHVVLLRGMNVGRDRSVSTAQVRSLLGELGYTEVASYLQSGNFALQGDGEDPATVAGRLDRAIRERWEVDFGPVVLTSDELTGVIEQNPYPGEADPKHLHAVFRQQAPPREVLEGIAVALERATARGSRDEATLVGRTLYLRTPEGMGRSELAAQLARAIRPGKGYELGTARNWATVTRLAALLES